MEGLGLLAGMMGFIVFIAVVVYVVQSLILMKLFQKAGVESWYAWIPFLNTAKMFELAGYKKWYILLFLVAYIPKVGGILVMIVAGFLWYQFTMSFTKNKAHGVLSIFFGYIIGLILAFSSDTVYEPAPKLFNEYI